MSDAGTETPIRTDDPTVEDIPSAGTGEEPPQAPPTEPRSRRRPSPEATAGIVAGLILFIWCCWTYWPLPLHLGTMQAGPPGDGWSGTAIWRALATEHLNPFAAGTIKAFNAPEGMVVPYQVNIQQWPTTIFYYVAARVVGADAGQTLYMTTGYVLTAGSMGWFLRRFVVRDSWIAVVLGCALALQPLSAVKGPGHTAFVHLWPIVFTIGAVLIMRETPTVRKAIIAGLLAFLTVSWSGYHLLLGGTAYGIVLLGTLLIAAKGTRKLAFRNTMIAGATTLVGLGVLGVWLKIAGHGADPTQAVRQNPLDVLTVYGARLSEYLVPPSGSKVFGSVTEPFFATRMHGSNAWETSVYMGNLLVGLAITGFVVGVVLRRRAEAEPREWRRPLMSRGTIVVAGTVVMLVAIASSFPPSIYVGGVEIPMPSRAFHAVLTTWRVYSRFTLVAAIGMLIMAAIGLAWLAGSGRRRIAVLALATVLIPLDLAVNVGHSIATTPPQIAAKVRALPPGIMAQYPLERGEGDGFLPIYYQHIYGRPVVNGFDDQATESRDSLIADLSDPNTIGRLNALNVKYVMTTTRPISPGDPVPPIPKKMPKGYEVVAYGLYGGYEAWVYQVPEQDNDVFIAPGRSYSGVPSKQTGPAWAASTDSTILLDGDCTSLCDGTIQLGLTSFATPRTVTVEQDGKPVAVSVGAAPKVGPVTLTPGQTTTLSIHVRFSRTSTLEITSSGKALPITAVDPKSTDPRLFTVGITGTRWIAPGSTDVFPTSVN
ncbi:MAG: hypothetical protein AAGC46_00665 [Solirubrobacteraceae bacterium]|nr:hypothetical protein [Patulibacter sp.]